MTSSTLIWMMDVTIRFTLVLDMTMKKVRHFIPLIGFIWNRLAR
jgi:hypothetical protein